MIKFIKDCTWSFRKRRAPKEIQDYDKGAIVTDIGEASEEEIVKARYAVYCTADGTAVKSNQTVAVETKDIQTKPVRKSGKANNDPQSD